MFLLPLPTDHHPRRLSSWVSESISSKQLPDYVYSYPPRQAFRPVRMDEDSVAAALASTPDNFNLYLHFPFCAQICGFCNLFTTSGSAITEEEYVDALILELRTYAATLPKTVIPRTVYFGGGTPSLLSPRALERVLCSIDDLFPGVIKASDETCIEVAPETLDRSAAGQLVDLGFTRVSLGVQTLNGTELVTMGRRHRADAGLRAIEAALASGLRDVCVDLINGLPEQTRPSWVSSVKAVISQRPPTVCIYNLTSRPHTGFARKSLAPLPPTERYVRYAIGQSLLLDAGYVHETHVRFVLPGVGGYRQKVNHWRGGTILGVGAGARTYSPSIHFDNGYSVTRRRETLHRYVRKIRESSHSRTNGIHLDATERMRQRLILSLHRLELSLAGEAEGLFGGQLAELLSTLEERGFYRRGETSMTLTPAGLMYRDVLAHSLFSPQVRALIETHSYR